MLCIKMFWMVTLWDGFVCSSNPCVELGKTLPARGVERCAEVWFWDSLVQVGINGVTLGGIAVESRGGWYSQAALCNLCDAVSELVCGMPVSYGFTVPGSRGISVSRFNPILFY